MNIKSIKHTIETNYVMMMKKKNLMKMTMMMTMNWNEKIHVWIFVEMVHLNVLIEKEEYDDDYYCHYFHLKELQLLKKNYFFFKCIYFVHDHHFVVGNHDHDLGVKKHNLLLLNRQIKVNKTRSIT